MSAALSLTRFIARPCSADPQKMDVLAMQLDGNPVEFGSYELDHTPCMGVLSAGFRAYPDQLGECFPDEPLLSHGIVAYAGYPLTGISGQTLGLVSIASRVPLRRVDRVESVMQIFAVRAAAEIERLRADETVRESEEAYRTIFESIEDGVVVRCVGPLHWTEITPAFLPGGYDFSLAEAPRLEARRGEFEPLGKADIITMIASAE